MSKKQKRKPLFNFLELLTILFIALKLLGKITWSWWWVLSPLWIPVVATLVILAIIFIVAYFLGKWG